MKMLFQLWRSFEDGYPLAMQHTKVKEMGKRAQAQVHKTTVILVKKMVLSPQNFDCPFYFYDLNVSSFSVLKCLLAAI